MRIEQNLKLSVVDCYNRLAGMYSHRTRPEIRGEYLTPLLALSPGARIFDAGCGAGHDALVLAKAGYVVTAVDFSPAMCRLAQDNLSGFHSAEVVEGDLETVSFGSARFDAVLSALEIFHHEDLERALKNYADLLTPRGLLVLVTNHPVRNMLVRMAHDYFEEGLVWEDWGNQGRVPKFHWTLGTYVDAITRAKLRISAIKEHLPSKDLAAVQDSAVSPSEVYPSLMTIICFK
jgi:SAM-dependent methyltransferase